MLSNRWGSGFGAPQGVGANMLAGKGISHLLGRMYVAGNLVAKFCEIAISQKRPYKTKGCGVPECKSRKKSHRCQNNSIVIGAHMRVH